MAYKYTYFIKEHDQQAGLIKYYKMCTFGKNAEDARRKVCMPKRMDYGYELLTLNQFNALKRKPSIAAEVLSPLQWVPGLGWWIIGPIVKELRER